jgi:ATP-dependent DNA ligase
VRHNGHDWTDRYPLIVEASLRNRSCSFIIDGEAGAARRRRHLGFQRAAFSQAQREVQLYAFDVLALDGDDLRKLPLHLRKNNLARLLARRPDGIFISTFEQGEIGPDLFRKACEFGLEGLVSKRGTALRPVAELDQGQEPQPPGDGTGQGVLRLTPSGAAGQQKWPATPCRPLPIALPQ